MGTRFLILGSQRSGTTLLGMTLQAHPDIEIIEESNQCFHTDQGLTKQLELLVLDQYKPDAHTHIGYKAPRDTHRIDEITHKIPDMRFVWISRDIFQVVASMVSLNLQPMGSWAEVFAPREILKYLNSKQHDKEIRVEYEWAASILDKRIRAIALAAVCWLTKRRSEITASTKWPDRNYRVHYSDLVTSPEESLKGVLAFLDIPWHPLVLDHPKVLSGKRPGSTSPSRGIDSESLNKWQAVLSSVEIELITALLQRHHNWVFVETG
jgi:hypothetical protein